MATYAKLWYLGELAEEVLAMTYKPNTLFKNTKFKGIKLCLASSNFQQNVYHAKLQFMADTCVKFNCYLNSWRSWILKVLTTLFYCITKRAHNSAQPTKMLYKIVWSHVSSFMAKSHKVPTAEGQ